MKTLEEYLEKAKHYLYDLTPAQLNQEKQRALDYYNSSNLKENFRKQVEASPDWVKLAESNDVFFYIEEPLKQNPGSTRNAFVETGVFLRIFGNSNKPVIKVVM